MRASSITLVGLLACAAPLDEQEPSVRLLYTSAPVAALSGDSIQITAAAFF
jgi:hypothetical protein